MTINVLHKVSYISLIGLFAIACCNACSARVNLAPLKWQMKMTVYLKNAGIERVARNGGGRAERIDKNA